MRTQEGRDISEAFRRGAEGALVAARAAAVRLAVLKDGSPSCGSRTLYDGTFSGVRRPGAGVTAVLLARAGIRVFSERELDQAEAHLASLLGEG